MTTPCSTLLLACLAGLAACGGDLVLPETGSPGGAAPTLAAADDRYSAPGEGDRSLSVAAPGVLANDRVDGRASASLQAAVEAGPSHGRLDLHPDGSLAYTPDQGWLGSDRFTYRAQLGSEASPAAEVVIEVPEAANVAPSFSAGPDQTVTRKKKDQTVEHWATGISPGPAAEAGQAVEFLVTVRSGGDALAGAPTISPDGTLRYRPSDRSGSATVEVRLRDDGGTANGGQDTSPPHTLVITVAR
jgi:hypothetical protein